MSANATYSSVYLVKLSYNESSSAFDDFHIDSGASATNISLTANYMAMCVSSDHDRVCTAADNTTRLDQSSSIKLGESKMSLYDISYAITEACHPRLLVAAIILSLLLLLMVICCTLPFFPVKHLVRRASCGLALFIALLWGLGSMLQHQTVEGAEQFISVASMGLVSVAKGSRAEAMAWTAFAFSLTSFFSLALTCFRELRILLTESPPPPPPIYPEKV